MAVGDLWDGDSGLTFPCAEVPVPVNPDELSHPLAVLRSAGQVSQGRLAPVVNLPSVTEKQFMVIEHELPGRAQLQEIATGIAQGDELPAGDDLARGLDGAAGLTRYETEGAFSLSIVRHGKLDPACIWNVKSRQLKKSGLVSIHRGSESFDQLGGLRA